MSGSRLPSFLFQSVSLLMNRRYVEYLSDQNVDEMLFLTYTYQEFRQIQKVLAQNVEVLTTDTPEDGSGRR